MASSSEFDDRRIDQDVSSMSPINPVEQSIPQFPDNGAQTRDTYASEERARKTLQMGLFSEFGHSSDPDKINEPNAGSVTSEHRGRSRKKLHRRRLPSVSRSSSIEETPTGEVQIRKHAIGLLRKPAGNSDDDFGSYKNLPESMTRRRATPSQNETEFSLKNILLQDSRPNSSACDCRL